MQTKKVRVKVGEYIDCIVDDDIYEKYGKYSWYAHKGKGEKLYVRWDTTIKGVKTKFILHRVIMDAPKGMLVDHIDGDTMNNLRSNLRICTQVENMRNQKKHINATSQYKGVSLCRATGKWVAQIRIDKKNIHLGTFAYEYQASLAYNNAAKKHFKEFALTNELETIDVTNCAI